ncbi:efflux pump antibiotic resistance protein, putative [Talaromyces stipitatus ATCC 10500]|uniref:Efflux pump antibiotic resistance protein, putative n=1 Tax=Talaromyces stipitatus (strain ATCC 10500 / CBS 375.48 / QM 6759 / NRRL 1006) TaxID=441959 RepID=B8MLT6_TALSN|nr:efflux pump antibiotic resistance protein, putative [Talaromyces stipitatus ATCC 10500]EED13803.1 efflux pump antibiotic resistance protein, putative [Talaromyces stipitatus ATCC 10500]
MSIETETETTTTSKAEVDAGQFSTASISNGDNQVMEKNDTIAAFDGEEKTEFFYLEGWRLWAIMGTLYLNTLLAALDVGIIATAIPAITDEFLQLNYVGWYGGTIFLTLSTASPVWGKLYKYVSARYVYLVSIVIFLVGSIVAATAKSSIPFIIARALQGLGCSGSIGGSVLMINYVAHPAKQPMLIGLWATVYMISTIIGPLIGGAFTSHVTWRWCFWINLPVGGPVLVAVILFFHVPKHVKYSKATWKEIILQLDLPGFAFIFTSLVCYTIALQWGGLTKPWSDGNVIATLVMWVVLTIGFFVVEYFQGERAMMPLRLLKTRLQWTNTLYAMMVNCAEFQVLFYLPIYFQSVHGQSAIASGVNTLPFIAFFALGSMMSGGIIGKTRIFQPFLLAGGLLATVGAALLYTVELKSSKARYLGSQVIFGFGIGLGCQVPLMALQSFTSPEDVASVTGIIVMMNSLSGGYFVTAAESVFDNRLLESLAVSAPSINPGLVLATGATQLRGVFKGQDLTAILAGYMAGVKDVFAWSLAGAAFTAVLALVVPFKKMPPVEDASAKEKSEDEKEETV